MIAGALLSPPSPPTPRSRSEPRELELAQTTRWFCDGRIGTGTARALGAQAMGGGSNLADFRLGHRSGPSKN